MKILLLHGEDEAPAGPWVKQRWDAVFDLGRGSGPACRRWAQIFDCDVRPLDDLRDSHSQMRRVRELLEWGRGRLVDREGLDWWELTAILIDQQLETLVLLKRFVDEVAAGAEVFVTRDGFEVRALRMLQKDRVRLVDRKSVPSGKGLSHYLRRAARLSGQQILDVVGDKYDGAYRFRRYLHRKTRRQEEPVVLLPTAYVNVSMFEIAYARLLPETAFLLVSTRRSGRLSNTPENVEQEWLASYAGDDGRQEQDEILARWTGMQHELGQVRELAILRDLGVMNDFPRRFAEGIAVRNAWHGVFEREPVKAVLCGDDSNPYTRIPLLLARQRGLSTIVGHHGAFDGRYLMKSNHADVILAKGRMEQDYLLHLCGVDPREVEIGAPSVPGSGAKIGADSSSQNVGKWIVFFSEPYEMASGRTEEIYRDILPKLIGLAVRFGTKVMVKLHPSESLHDRQTMASTLFGREAMGAIEWRTGRLGPELLDGTWFGITATSSVVMDCAVRRIPCFICEWLEMWPYGYISQYRKFGVGIGLTSPEDLLKIPQILQNWKATSDTAESCWQEIKPSRLNDLLAGKRRDGTAEEGER